MQEEPTRDTCMQPCKGAHLLLLPLLLHKHALRQPAVPPADPLSCGRLHP